MKKRRLWFLMSCFILSLTMLCACSNTEQLKEDIKDGVSNVINELFNESISNDYDSSDINVTNAAESSYEETTTNTPTDRLVPTAEPDTKPTDMLDSVATPEPSVTQEPTVTPEPTATLAPTATQAPTATLAPTATPKPTNTPTPEPTKAVKKYRFRNYSLLDQHYEKHGIEMGFASAEEYEIAASAVVTNPDALHKIEAEDGDDIYYVESTNEFVVVSQDGYIRTYFLPSSGKKYYDRQ